VRLFTAFWVGDDAVEALRGVAGLDEPPPGWRAVDPCTWHITLAFHGEADPGELARGLDRAALGMPAPRLRTADAGAFDGVRWAGVEADPDAGLRELVEVAGGQGERFVPHVTLLRRRRRPGPGAVADPPTPWAHHTGPWWRPLDLLLVGSEPARGGSRYRVVHRVPLRAG
jgi:2'-5' RNA ligase